MPDQETPSLIICKSCGNSFHGNFCNECGEKVLKPADRSFKAFLSNILIAITFADSKLIKTLWLVLSKPGFISKEFTEGRRVNYLKPISLFFVLNLIYFFFPLIQLFNATLHTQLLSPLAHFYKSIVAHKIVELGLNVESFKLIYDQKTTGFAKLMVMVFVVVASLPLNLFYWKRNRFFTDHVGYMIELACFNLFTNTLVLSVIAFFGLGHYLSENVLSTIFITTNLYFLIRSGYRKKLDVGAEISFNGFFARASTRDLSLYFILRNNLVFIAGRIAKAKCF